MERLRKRHWALYSDGAGAGKTTFLGANARRPIYAIDADGRFDAVEALAEGDVIYPTQFIEPLTLAEESLVIISSKNIASIVADSVTKLYSVHARLGYMRARAGRQKNRAAEMVDKSNQMAVLRDLAALGTDMYYCWHRTHGIDSSGSSEIRDMVSAIELARLDTSINVWLLFKKEGGRYGITVERARDYAGRPANTGFTMWDEPGNYWKGGAERLERLIYTSFKSRTEAIGWMAEKLQLEIDEAEAEYEHIKEEQHPATHSLMWVAIVERVYELTMKPESAGHHETEIISSVEPPSERVSENDETEPFTDDDTNIDRPLPDSQLGDEAEPPDIDSLRQSLNVPGVTIGAVCYAAATARGGEMVHYAPKMLERLKEYPFTEEQQEIVTAGKFKIEMEQKLTPATAISMYDWLVGLPEEDEVII